MKNIQFPYQGLTKAEFIRKALNWANSFSHFAYYNSNDIEYPYNGFQELLAVGCKEQLVCNDGEGFDSLKKYYKNLRNEATLEKWLFGYLGYDLKNEVEKLSSQNQDHTAFPDIQFFSPSHLLVFKEDSLEVTSSQENVVNDILAFDLDNTPSSFSPPIASTSRDTYLSNVETLRSHIEEGDCYEVNYCQEFHGEVHSLNIVELYISLNEISPNPFSCLQKFNEHSIISASPERFIRKSGERVISQPIKGTRPRSEDPNEDIRLKTELRNDIKELAENMMIVDLVRNDLARTANTGSIRVEEMFGIYSFRQVHQMISTITSEARSNINPIDIIKSAFPMGSMTGAPKVKVMQLIEELENTRRGAFSGAAGYINSGEEFDFNVLIRSLFINQKTGKYSFQVGGAITYDSIPEKEFEECMIKAKAIVELISKNPLDKVNLTSDIANETATHYTV